MATATLLTSGVNGWDSPVTYSFTTASITPGTDCALVLLIYITQTAHVVGPGMTVVSSGSGPTWTKQAASTAPTNWQGQTALWTATVAGTSPGAFTVTVDWASTEGGEEYGWALYRVTGHEVSTTFTGAVCSPAADGGGDGPRSITLSAAPAAADIVFAITGADAGAPSDAVFDNTARTWTRDVTGGSFTEKIAFGAGHSTGSTSTTVAWSDVNEDNSDNYSSSQAAITVKANSTTSLPGLGGSDQSQSAAALGTFTQHYALTGLAGSSQGQLTANVGLGIAGTLGTANAFQTQTTTVPVLVQHGVLVGLAGSSQAQTAANVTVSGPSASRYPVAAFGRKLIDQNGEVIQLRTLSSWGMVEQLSNATMTVRLEQAAARGFNSVNVVIDASSGTSAGGWSPYSNGTSGLAFYTGAPYASTLGPAWATHVAHLMNETARLGMFVLVSCYPGNIQGDGAGSEMVSAGAANCRLTGQRWATFLSSWQHWILHIGFDAGYSTASGEMVNSDQLCRGVKDIRPGMLIVGEQGGPLDMLDMIPPGAFTWLTPIESMYKAETFPNAVEAWDATYTTDPLNGPVWDCEAIYIGHDYNGFSGAGQRQQLRERHYTVPIRGGVGINNGHEDWWPFGGSNGLTAGDTAATAMNNVSVIEWQYGWAIWDLCSASDWAPVSTFVTTGLGAGDAKAAQGASSFSAVAYFPSSRTVTVDTTILSGTGVVRLRWFDPVLGTYTLIAAGEAQTASRTVSYPSNHADGTSDWVLVVDEAPTINVANATHGHLADNLILSASGVLVVASAVHGHLATSIATASTNVRVGTNSITNAKVGTSQVSKLMMGTVQVWP